MTLTNTKFYTDILGFELGDVTIDPRASYVYEIFAIDRSITTRHAIFHAGDNKRVLSVVEIPGVELPRPPQSPRMSVALFNASGRFDESGIEIGFLDRDGHLYALYEYPYSGSLGTEP